MVRLRDQFRLRAAARRSSRSLGSGYPPVWVMTDPERLPVKEVLSWDLPRGWGVIYRHFGAADRREAAALLAGHCRRRGVRLLVAGDPELALAVGADGVHWPEASAGKARRWKGRFRLVTMSWHGRTSPMVLPQGIDAVLASAVFPSNSPSAGSPLGPVRYRRLALSARVPVYGLGGVSAETACAISGVGGLAGIEGFSAFRRSQPRPGARVPSTASVGS